ncbi:SBBP repeat-containing protein [Corallococcus sp. M34]|nr:SBBP repeat-containing protein [Citreicoccus inhibens]
MVPTGVGGTLDWICQLGTPDDEKGQAVATTREGVYSTGYSTGTFDSNVPVGASDVVAVKHLPTGAKVWSKQYGTAVQDVATAIATYDVVHATPEIYITGYTLGSWGAPSAGGFDPFLLKVDPTTGATVWVRQFGSGASDQAFGVATDPTGAVYVAGHTAGNLAAPTKGGSDLFVAKYSATGAQVWIRQLGSSGDEFVKGVATDAENNVYVAGQTSGSLGSASSGSTDLFLVKYDSAGNLQWIRQMGTPGAESVFGVATSRRLSGAVDVYVVGYTGGAFDGHAFVGGYDAIVVSFASNGEKQWSDQFGTLGSDLALAIASDGGANVYVTGRTNYDLDTNAADSSDNIFMLKYAVGGGPLLFKRQLGSVNAADPSVQNDSGLGVAADINDSVYVTGYTQGGFTNPATTNAGSNDYVLLRFTDGCQINTPGQCGIGYGWGDPHLVTFDGRAYDFQGAGEFILVESTTTTPLTVQARMRPWGTSRVVSVMTALATRLGTNRVGIYLGAGGAEVRVDGLLLPIATGSIVPLPGGGRILHRDENSYVLYYPGQDRLIVTVNGTYLDANFSLPTTRRGKIRGLLGNYDGSILNDLALRNGTFFTSPLTFAQLYTGAQNMASSWRITAQESLFDYGPNESTEFFTDVNFPEVPTSVSGLSAAQRDAARTICMQAGIQGAAILDNCVLDVALTQNSAFATAAALLERQVQVQGGGTLPVPTSAGQRVYFSNFQNGVGQEWSSTAVSTTPQQGRTFLGEFKSQAVYLSLQQLPAHASVTVSFDLLILRDWAGEGSPAGGSWGNNWGMVLNGQSVLETTFSNVSYLQSYPALHSSPRSGSEANNTLGYPWGDSLYRLKLKVSSTSPGLLLEFHGQGLDGANNKAWGLDNVEVLVE